MTVGLQLGIFFPHSGTAPARGPVGFLPCAVGRRVQEARRLVASATKSHQYRTSTREKSRPAPSLLLDVGCSKGGARV